MRAARIHRYGTADELRVEEVASPELGPHDVRVKVHASSINPIDFKVRQGAQRSIIRLPMPWTLGMDVSGEIVELGKKVSGFEVGEEVFASPHHKRMGCYADEVVVRASELARKPKSLTHHQAAALPLVGLTAWDALVGNLRVGKGDKVLIQAGSGGVGTIAIQLAKHLGAEVYTTCSERNVELVRGLGADHVINYREQQFEEVAEGVDAILECIGGDHIPRAIQTVRRGGRVALITTRLPSYTKRHGPTLGVLVMATQLAYTIAHARLTRGVRVALVTRRAKGENLQQLADLVDAGAIKPVIDRVMPLEEIADAHRYLETGRARGKVVIALQPA